MTKRLAVLAATSILAVTAACGGGGDRPSADEVSEALQKNEVAGSEVPKESADCVAEAFVESDLSDEALQAIVDGEEDYDASSEDEKAVADVSEKVGKCLTSE